MTAETLIDFVADPTLTKTLISSYETGRHLPSLDRLTRLLRALGAEITSEIEAHYRECLERTASYGQVQPGARTRIAAAKEIISAWQTAGSPQEAADMLGIHKGQLIVKAANLRKRGIPLKKFVLSKTDYSGLEKFAALFIAGD